MASLTLLRFCGSCSIFFLGACCVDMASSAVMPPMPITNVAACPATNTFVRHICNRFANPEHVRLLAAWPETRHALACSFHAPGRTTDGASASCTDEDDPCTRSTRRSRRTKSFPVVRDMWRREHPTRAQGHVSLRRRNGIGSTLDNFGMELEDLNMSG